MQWNKDTIGLSAEAPELIAPLLAAMNIWNAVDCGRLKLVLDPASENRVILHQKKDWNFEPSVLAMTTLTYFRKPAILSKVQIDVNQGDKNWSFTDYQNILLHELGHVLGLEHVEQFDAVMHPFGQLGLFELELSKTDKANFCELVPLKQQIVVEQNETEYHRELLTGCSQTNNSSDMALLGLMIFVLLCYKQKREFRKYINIGFKFSSLFRN